MKAKTQNGTFDVPETQLGSFTIDPRSDEYKSLRPLCKQGHPWKCLIASAAQIHIGHRVSVRINHEDQTGIIGLTAGDWRFERWLEPDEVKFAIGFDLGRQLRKPLTLNFDLNDGRWSAKTKQVARGTYHAQPTEKRQLTHIRLRQLQAIQQQFMEQEEED